MPGYMAAKNASVRRKPRISEIEGEEENEE